MTNISKVEEISGFGVIANVDGKDILVGNEKLMKEKNIQYTKCNEIGTILYVAIENEFVGYIVIADKVKKDSAKAISNLKNMNIKKTVMLTGDKKEVGENIAEKLRIDEVYTELLPDGKVKKVEELLKEKDAKSKISICRRWNK